LLEGHFTEVQTSHTGIDKMLDSLLNNMTNLYFLYKHGTIATKRRIIVSTYPEKFIFNGSSCPNTKTNEVLTLISSLQADSSENKNGTFDQKNQMYREVELAGVEPASKHIPQKASTCLFMHCFFETRQGHN